MTAAVKRPRSGGGGRRAGPSVDNFYTDALAEAERLQIAGAERLDGLDNEIAVLRVRLKTALRERPTDLRLLMQGMEILVRAVATQYRLSPKARRDLAESFAATLNSVGDQLGVRE